MTKDGNTGPEPGINACVENEELLDGIPAQIWHLTAPDTYGAVNAAHAEFIGRPKSAIENRNIRDFLPAGEAEAFAAANRAVFASGRPWSGEQWSSDSSGRKRLLYVKKLPWPGPDGKISMLVCSAVDITERALAEEKLRESELRWQYALEGAGDGVWDWDIKTGKIFFSRRWKEMLGYSEEEVGDSLEEWSKRVHPDDLQEAMALVRRHLDGLTPQYWSEHRVLCKDGSYKWILDRGKVVLRDKDGMAVRCIGTHSDIDAIKRLEAENRETLAELTTLMDHMHAGVLLESPERRVMFANRQFCELFSIPAQPAELTGADCEASAQRTKEMMKDPESFIAGIREAISSGRPVTGVQLELADGRFYEQNYIPVFLKDGRFIGHMWKYNDITEKKRLDAMRAEVTHHVNHELRRPIGDQVLVLDYLRNELAGKLTPEQETILSSAIGAADNMTRMVEDLLDVTRSETGKLSMRAEDFSLEKLAAEIAASKRPFASKQGLELRFEAEAGLPPVRADQARVRQVLSNLADNAFKFTPSPGTVSIRLARSAAEPGMAEVSVADTGPGIEKGDLDKVFDRLYQGLQASRKGMTGLGLGLYIAKMLVERQGGRIWAESEKGRGSVFRFTLPFAEKAG
ncbi:MAG: PAS domain S-box protein [Elusimicrobiales bacterium]|nr:PAS domain S-box protein [Elusimicrobiales bacterium]